MNIRFFLIVILFVSFSTVSFSQNSNSTTTTNSTPSGVRITTKITATPSLTEQVKDLEQKVKMAKANSLLVDNGTLAKYEYALAERLKQLAEENAPRSRSIKKDNK